MVVSTVFDVISNSLFDRHFGLWLELIEIKKDYNEIFSGVDGLQKEYAIVVAAKVRR